MKLPQLSDFNLAGKKVLVRADLDVPLRQSQDKLCVEDDERLQESLPTIKSLLESGASVILMGHLGRPEGRVVEELKMAPVAQKLAELLGLQVQDDKLGEFDGYRLSDHFFLLENLRFNSGEEGSDSEFAQKLAALGDFYVNEAFASSHRPHASIIGVPQLLPHAVGLHFAKEVENLSRVVENPQRPLVFIIGGAKPETKLPLVYELSQKADLVLVGGKIAEGCQANEKIICASLTANGLDVSEESINLFSQRIGEAGTVVWNGPMGKYEDEKEAMGTRRIAEAVANFKGFKVVGGGDTIAALTKFGLLDKMDYVSTGGGAMLELLAKGTLPGIEALK